MYSWKTQLESDRSQARRPGRSQTIQRLIWQPAHAQQQRDIVAVEEPLEIRLRAQGQTRPLVVTLRTPGHDFELAAGFLLSEGLLHQRWEIGRMVYCVGPDGVQNYNTVRVELRGELPSLEGSERSFMANSACGICGKASLEQLSLSGLTPLSPTFSLAATTLAQLTQPFQQAQTLFAETGGLHAAALFDAQGSLLALREDVGRHNAVDKVLGWGWLQAAPLSDHLLLLSGRIGYELVVKALRAGVGLIAAIGAPTSLAVEVAQAFGLTLVGFLRPDRFNVYTHPERLEGLDSR
jgi:FdhD protein